MKVYKKIKLRYSKWKYRINAFSLPNENKVKHSKIGKRVDEKEAQEMKNKDCQNWDKRTDIIKHTQFKVEDVFGDILSKGSISKEQTRKLNFFSAEMM